jgi:UDP-glucose 4-epimerase
VINGDGSNTRDFVYVGDVARAIVEAMESKGEFDVFNVCTGHETTLELLATTIKRLLRCDVLAVQHLSSVRAASLGPRTNAQ